LWLFLIFDIEILDVLSLFKLINTMLNFGDILLFSLCFQYMTVRLKIGIKSGVNIFFRPIIPENGPPLLS